MENIIILTVSGILLGMYLLDLRKNKFDLKTMVTIGMMSAVSFVLYMIQFIKYPQGGGISLFSMLPVMLLSILFGRTAGLTGGLIFGLLKLLNGAFVVHPGQFLLDYILSTMVLGLAGVFGSHRKVRLISGCSLAVALSVGASVISGVVYFGQYAPEGMNVWLYSFIYNFSSAGVEGILTIILIAVLPLNRIRSIAKVQGKEKRYEEYEG